MLSAQNEFEEVLKEFNVQPLLNKLDKVAQTADDGGSVAKTFADPHTECARGGGGGGAVGGCVVLQPLLRVGWSRVACGVWRVVFGGCAGAHTGVLSREDTDGRAMSVVVYVETRSILMDRCALSFRPADEPPNRIKNKGDAVVAIRCGVTMLPP